MSECKADVTHHQHPDTAWDSTPRCSKPEPCKNCTQERVARQASIDFHPEHTEHHSRNAAGQKQKWVSGHMVCCHGSPDCAALAFSCELFLTCSSSPCASSAAHGAKSHSSSPETPANHCWERFPASFLSSLHPSQGKDLGKQRPWRGLWSTVFCPGALLILHTGTGRNMEWAHPGFFSLRHGTGCSPRGLWEEENNG